MELVWPSEAYLASYVATLQRGWSPNNLRLDGARHEELAAIAAGPASFVAALVDKEAKGSPITMPDGSTVPRLPGYRKWMWDGEFCGSIQLRWQQGSNELPPYCLGHIGFSVVPWKQNKGYATLALARICKEASEFGLAYVEVTTSPGNLASQKVITANGGIWMETFVTEKSLGGQEEMRFEIALP